MFPAPKSFTGILGWELVLQPQYDASSGLPFVLLFALSAEPEGNLYVAWLTLFSANVECSAVRLCHLVRLT